MTNGLKIAGLMNDLTNVRKRIFDVRRKESEILELEILAKASINFDFVDSSLYISDYCYMMFLYLDEELHENVANDGKIIQFERSIRNAVNEELDNYEGIGSESIVKARIVTNDDSENCKDAIKPTKKMLDAFEKYKDNISSDEKKVSKKIATPSKPKQEKKDDGKKNVFIVHGHDEKALTELDILLRKLDIKPTILKDEDSGGETIIGALDERISEETDLVIVLMTPDDEGRAVGEADLKFRARQNVIFEMGMARGTLGKERVFFIKNGDLEIHSDINGLIFEPYKTNVKEVAGKLIDRLESLGFRFTAEQIKDTIR